MISGDQIHAASPLKTTRSAIVAITTVSTLARSSGRITVRCSTTPPANAIPSVAANAHQYERPWCAFRLQAMYVVNIAISPWAKLITSVAL